MQAVDLMISISSATKTPEPLIALSDVFKIHPQTHSSYPNACVFGATLSANDHAIALDTAYMPETMLLPFLIRTDDLDAFGNKSTQTQWIFVKVLLNWRKDVSVIDRHPTPKNDL